MTAIDPTGIRALRDDRLTGRLYELRRRERQAQVEFLVHLGELDRRRLLRVTRDQAERRRRGSGHAARAPITSGRYVAAAIRDEVWRRDGGRCTFVGSTGHRCASAHMLELHHIVPFARGGAATAGNLTLHCRAHNADQAEQDFGTARITASIVDRQASLF